MTERNGDMSESGHRRVTVEDAARVLEISESAIRKRIERNTLRSVRENGTRYVLLETDPAGHDTDTTRHDTDTTGHDTDMSAASTSTAALIGAKDETIGELREMVAQLGRIIESRDEELRREREARIEEKRRHDTILLRMTERIPELEAPQTTAEDAGGSEEVPERRSWWRRWFGFE